MSPDLVERYRSARRDPGLAVLEGLHALKHALRFGADIRDARTRGAAALLALARDLAPDVAQRMATLAQPVDPDTFDELAPSPHPTGVIALAARPAIDPTRVLGASGPAPVVLLERPTHHGNIGAVVRVAAAAGAAGVLVTGPHDPWHPASIRGGAGLQFALPVGSLEPVGSLGPDGLDMLLGSRRPIVAMDPEGQPLRPPVPGAEPLVPPRAVLVFGSERTGVSDRLLMRSARRVSIPMRPGVSSLNLATAVAVTLYLAATGGEDPMESRP